MKPIVSIIDTNIVVAGLITGDTSSPPARILDAMLIGELIYLMSAERLTGLSDTTARAGKTQLGSIH